MKKSQILISFSIFSLGFNVLANFKNGDLIELSQSLNARTSLNFYKNANNIKKVLHAGTFGLVEESIKLESGNYGVKMRLNSGEAYWVYYNVNTPGLALSTKQNEPTLDLENAYSATVLEPTEALADQSDKEAVSRVIRSQKEIDDALKQKIAECLKLEEQKKLAKKIEAPKKEITSSPSSSLSLTSELNTGEPSEFDISMDSYPYRAVHDLPLESVIQRSVGNNIDIRYLEKEGKKEIQEFTITNKGGNHVVKSDEYYISRTYNLSFENLARSDMHLMVTDSPDSYTSNSTYNLLMFFPRTKLPSVKVVGDENHLTLPTGELVVFDAKTNTIKSGVLSEKPMAQLPVRPGCNYEEKACGRKAVGDIVDYTGAGVVIKMHKSGDLPYGDREVGGKPQKNTDIALIKKQGKTCKVPANELWYTDYQKKGQVFFKKEYATDEAFDQFLVKRCGFSMK